MPRAAPRVVPKRGIHPSQFPSNHRLISEPHLSAWTHATTYDKDKSVTDKGWKWWVRYDKRWHWGTKWWYILRWWIITAVSGNIGGDENGGHCNIAAKAQGWWNWWYWGWYHGSFTSVTSIVGLLLPSLPIIAKTPRKHIVILLLWMRIGSSLRVWALGLSLRVCAHHQ